jgi:hypothetical protein
MHRPAVGAYRSINLHPPHLLGEVVITPYPHPESRYLHAPRHGENLTNPGRQRHSRVGVQSVQHL